MPSPQIQPAAAVTQQPVTISVPGQAVPAGQFTCVTGILRRRPAAGIPFRGTFLVVSPFGQVVASITPAAGVNLAGLENQFVTVCGVSEGVIEGVTAVRATAAFPAGQFFPQFPFGSLFNLLQQNPALLQFLLQNPSLLQAVLQNPALLQQLLLFFPPGIFGFPTPFGAVPGFPPGSFGAVPGFPPGAFGAVPGFPPGAFGAVPGIPPTFAPGLAGFQATPFGPVPGVSGL